MIHELLESENGPAPPLTAPVFTARGQPLTRYGIYKIVRRHTAQLDDARTGRRIGPHTFRHTAAVHLLEAGVEVNVIRGWLGHADLTTTNRYAEINTKAKQQALLAHRTARCFGGIPHHANLAHRRDAAELALLALTVMCPKRPRATPPTAVTPDPITARGHITRSGTEDR